MENSFEATLLQYRHALRNLLAERGISSNPVVEDEWIMDEVSKLLVGKPIVWLTCEKCEAKFPGYGSLLIHSYAHKKTE